MCKAPAGCEPSAQNVRPKTEEVAMKHLMTFLVFVALLVGAAASTAFAQQTDKDQNGVKQTTKDVAKDTKRAAKATGKAVKKTTKKVVHKGAKKTEEGASKVEDKTNPPK